mgnify:FL=1|jgi:hypothetical protein|tara:strand:+ start:724 stop:1272 length:549 start_codon:yes stop_codon:yes gene_type:complete
MNFKDYIFIFTLFSILLLAIKSPPSKPEFLEVHIEEEVIPVYVKSDYELFLDAIGHQESGNRYNVVNRYGYMGKYQFGKSTLKTLKIKVTRQEFLNDTFLQEYAMHKHLLYNKKRLDKYINKYEGQIVNDILVTESGLLAAAHLCGAGSVKKWFRTGKIAEDGNGVTITSYMKRFGGYDLSL